MNTTQTKLASQEAAHRDNEQKMRTVFHLQQTDKISEDMLLSTLNVRLREVGVQTIGRFDELDDVENSVANELGGNEDARLAALHVLKGRAQQLGIASNYKDLLDQLATGLSALEGEVSARDGPIITEFLARGREIVADQEGNACPICEQDVDKPAVLARLDERIAADTRL